MTVPAYALKGGDMVNGHEVWDTRPVFGGFGILDTNGHTFLIVPNDEFLVTTD